MKPFIYLDAFIRSIVMLLGIQIRMLFVRVVVGGQGAIWRKVVRVFLSVRGLTATIRSSNEPTCVWGLSIEKLGTFNPLKPELNPICYLLALLAHHFLHVSRIRVKSLPLGLLMSYIYIYIYIYIYMEHLFLMFLDHTQRRSTVGRTPLDE